MVEYWEEFPDRELQRKCMLGLLPVITTKSRMIKDV